MLDFISTITKNDHRLKDSFEFGSLIDKQDHNSFMWTILWVALT